MKKAFPYKSLHQYLDSVFAGMDPTPEQVKQQKKIYWRAYNTYLKQNQRAKRKEITIALDKELVKVLSQKSTQSSLPWYIKKLIIQHIEEHATTPLVELQDTTRIEQQLFLVIDYLQSLLYQRRIIDKGDTNKLQILLEELQELLENKF